MENTLEIINETFKRDVDLGLSAPNKYLSSKYFYDAKGDALFVEIMNLSEYYLTNAEYDIFKNQTHDLLASLKLNRFKDFDLIELGVGNGKKTKELLKTLNTQGYQFTYMPVDISANALNKLTTSIHAELPDIFTQPKQGDYFNILKTFKGYNKTKVILFLGSNIGNLNDSEAQDFIQKLSDTLNINDKIILGADLIKPKNIVLPAYNDSEGITRKFNLNLLERINRELDANFNLNAFDHHPEYSEDEGIAISYLLSKENQEVTIGALNKVFQFTKNERIHTEISRKYSDTILNTIIRNSNLKIIDKFMDSKHYFADYILEKY